MAEMMRALRLHGPHDLRLEEMARPTAGPGEIVARVVAVGICWTDIELYKGLHGALLRGLSTYPFTPGHEWSGQVVEVGEGVTDLQAGDLVVGETGIGCLHCALCRAGHHQLCPQGTETGIVRRDGAMREYHVQRADFVHRFGARASETLAPRGGGASETLAPRGGGASETLAPRGGGGDPVVAALTEPASVGVYACHKTGVSPLDRVAIVGAGAIGQCCLQAARGFGARQVVMVSRSLPKLELAEHFGADAVVNSRETDVVAAAADLTDGDLFDVVLEAAGTEPAFRDALVIGGYVSRIGMVGLSSAEPFGYGLETVINREQTIMGVRGSPHVYPQTIQMIEAGVLQLEPLISHRFGLEEYVEAFGLAEQGGPDVLRVMLTL
jgi:L-iditol 2-dehydrogenase